MKIEIDPTAASMAAPAKGESIAGWRPTPYDPRPALVPLWRRGAPWLLVFLVCCAWDRAVWLMATQGGRPILQWLEDSIAWENLKQALKAAAHLDLHALGQILIAVAYGLIYVFGRIWPWIGLSLFFIFRHWGGTDRARVREGLRRGVFVFLVPAAAGSGAEALKLLIRRARPEAHEGLYQFMPWPKTGVLGPDFWSTTGLGLASSHAAVAFGAALAAGLLLPRWRVGLFVLAALCALGRVAVGAHFVSDAFAGAAFGLAAYKIVYAWDRRNNGGVGIAA